MKKMILTLALLGWFAPFAQAADMAATIQDRYAQTPALSGKFRQTLVHRESNSSEDRTGTIEFQKPLLVRWETATPEHELLVVSDKEIWDYFPEEELAYHYPLEAISDPHNILHVLTGQARLSQDFEIKSAGKENGLEKLLLYPKEPTNQLVEATIWVEPDSGLIKRVKILDFYGNSNDVELLSLSTPASIDKESFNFSPPSGTEIEDYKDGPEKGLFN